MAPPAPRLSDPMLVFDRLVVRRHRDRAAPGLHRHDFLFRHVAAALAERLDDVKREFPIALDLGCHGGEMTSLLPGRKGIGRIIACDLSPAMAARIAAAGEATALVADEEVLPFADESFDLAVSNLSLHWVNDLPGALVQIRRALKPDGLFLAAMLGGDTLTELRRAMLEAEMTVAGGASPRVSPFADLRDIGALMQRAGFALPVVDVDTVTVTYENAFGLLSDLRGMGETSAARTRNRRIPARAFWPEVARTYQQLFGGADGRIPATFQIIYVSGWAPHESQQQPLRPGSAGARFADVLGTVEIPTGDKARPR